MKSNKDPILQQLLAELKTNADPHTQASSQRFFKEEVSPYGVKTAIVNRLAREFYQCIKEKPKVEIFALCEELWRSGMLEESLVACEWSERQRRRYEAEDFEVFDRWVKQYVSNWASCDTLCNHTVGNFLEDFPQFLTRLQDWARSENRWVRRAAAVSLIVPARKGSFLEDIFSIADILLRDEDDLVRKGYGWMLKAASQAHLNEVFDYVMKHKAVMPRTALRYAIEKMPEEMRLMAMEK
jgi:3-methyladenine DNA glycosylase AlkD